MSNFKIKLLLSALGGIVFSLLFILLAFALPFNLNTVSGGEYKKPNKLQQISQALKKELD